MKRTVCVAVGLLFAAAAAADTLLDLGGESLTTNVVSSTNYSDATFPDGLTVANGELTVNCTRFFRPGGTLTISNAVFTLPDSDSSGQLNFNTNPGENRLRLVAGATFYAGSSRSSASYIGNDATTSTGRIDVVQGSVFTHTNANFHLARSKANGYLTGRNATLDFGSKAIYLDHNGGGKAKIALTNCNLSAWSIRVGDGEAANVHSSAFISLTGGTNTLGAISCATNALIPSASVTFNGTFLKATRDIANWLDDGGGYSAPVFHVGARGLVLDVNGCAVGLKSPIDGGGTVYVTDSVGTGSLTVADSVTNGVENAVAFTFAPPPTAIAIDPPLEPVLYTTGLDSATTRLALSSAYAGTTCGRFVLATVKGSLVANGKTLAAGDAAEAFFDPAGIDADYSVKVEASPAGDDYLQLALEVGDYASASVLKVMPMGDSITHRSTTDSAYGANRYANYRLMLMDLLAAKGYRVKSVGFWNDANFRRTLLAGPSDYAAHTAFSGEQIITSATLNGNAGLRESLDNLLDTLSESPDVITLMIGTNDLNNDFKDAGVDLAPLVTAWSNLVLKLTRRYPSAQILTTSVLPFPTTSLTSKETNAARFSEAIASVVARGAFSAAQVKFVDLRARLPRTTEDYLAESNLHPSWTGHAKLARAWCDAILASRAGERPSVTPSAETTTSGAAANVSAAYRAGLAHLLTLRLAKSGKGSAAATVIYSNAAFRASTALKRVAYYLELKRTQGAHRRFVWADMDAWGERTLGALALPLATSYQGYADNVHVASNMGAIHPIAPEVKGKRALVQFTYHSIETNNVASLTPGLEGWYDWNDHYLSGAWGLMNVNRVFDAGDASDVAAAEVLFSYNAWNRSVAKAPFNEIGIGNCALNYRVTGDQGKRSLNYVWTGQDTETLNRLNACAYDPDQGGEMLLEIWGQRQGGFQLLVY